MANPGSIVTAFQLGAPVSVGNTTTETSLIGGPVTLLDSAIAATGNNLHFRAKGYMGYTAGTITLRVLLGGTTVWSSGALSPTAGSFTGTSTYWCGDWDTTTVGTTQVESQGNVLWEDGGQFVHSFITGSHEGLIGTTVTGAPQFNFTVQYGTADAINTMRCRTAVLEHGGSV